MQFDEARLLSALVSPCSEQCIKTMRTRKMVLLCVQNGQSTRAAEAMRAARELHADPKYAQTTEIVTLDPSDEAEAGFLKQLGIDPRIPDAITVIIAPSGQTLNRFRGGATKQALASAIQKAASAAQCGPNASPGCCPPKKPKPKK